MFSITNAKIAGFTPRWARFRGFSVLFDSPGDCLVPHGQRLDLACDLDGDAELGFYKGLRDGLTALEPDLLTATYLFCPLPPPSYHVTAWDGGNDGNVTRAVGSWRAKLEEYLAALPDTATRPHDLTDTVLASPLVSRRDWGVEFQFDALAIWGGSVLVARLAPTDAARSVYEQFVAERGRLSATYRGKFGVGASERYTPHVSLGYFANREGGQMAMPCLHEWNQVFTEGMRGLTLSFEHASVYGFTDMATFFTSAAPASDVAS